MARILITSALPYINGIKHLGNLIGSQLPSDVYARFMRAAGHEVLLICATDEHGTPAELAAADANQEVEIFCNEMWEKQRDLANGFYLSFDFFGRSSSQRNHQITQHFAGKLHEAGLIREVVEDQFFSVKDDRFLPDRYIQGTCPSCGYEKARGDQCESCTKQLDPTDLVNPRSAISGTMDIERRRTKHLYLRQSKMRKHLRDWLSSKKNWPTLSTSIAMKWLNDGEGLQDRGITRDLKWGIPVKKGKENWPGLEDKVFYVWFDAPIEYISATAEWADSNKLGDSEWERWWRTDKGANDVYYVQFMAKDNIPFHTLSFPVTIMGSGEPWKLVDYVKGFNWLLYEGGKFSTSENRGVFMDKALETFPPDYWRWWLLSNAPETSDTDFTWTSFQNSVNKDLADVLGNFVSRVTKFCEAKFGSKIPSGGNYENLERSLIETIDSKLSSYSENMNAIELRKAAADLRSIWSLGNEYLQVSAPWSAFKTNPDRAAAIIRFSFNLIAFYANISHPFIPATSIQINKNLNLDTNLSWPKSMTESLNSLQPGHTFSVPKNLFQKLSDTEVTKLKEIFSGGAQTKL